MNLPEFELTTIVCGVCGYENEYDADTSVILCEGCEELIFTENDED